MTRVRLAEGLAAAARVEREALIAAGDALAARDDVRVLEAPEARTVLVELETAVGAFTFTEVVVTTARAVVGERSGWGCVLGKDELGALAAALLDADGSPHARALAETALAREASDRQAEARAIAETRV